MNAARIAFAIILLAPVKIGSCQDNQPLPSETGSKSISVTEIQQRQQSVQASTLDDEAKQHAMDLYGNAVKSIQKAEDLAKQATAHQNAVTTAETRAADLKERIRVLQDSAPASVDESKPLAVLEQQLIERGAELQRLKQLATDADGIVATRTERRKSIRSRLIEIEQELAQQQQQLEQPPASGEPAEVTAARRTEIQAVIERLRQEAPTLELQLAAYDAESAVEFQRLSRDELSLRLEIGEKEADSLQRTVQSRREAEASKQMTAAAREAESETNPQLQAIAQRNVELTEQSKKLTESIRVAEQRLGNAVATLDHWKEVASSAQEKVDAIGLTDTIGAMLRQQKTTLPNRRRYQARIDKREVSIGDVQLDLLKLKDEQSRQPNSLPSDSDDAVVVQRANELAANQSEYLSTLIRTQEKYFNTLVKLSNTEQQIINETTEQAQFINERILWVRSSPPLYSSFAIDRSDLTQLDAKLWADAMGSIRSDLVTGALWYVSAAIVILLLLVNGGRFRRELRSLGEVAESGSCTDMSPTVRATSLTILIALPWPAIFAFLAWRLSNLPTDNQVIESLARGCSSIATVVLPLEFFRQVCQPRGLGESHFGWSKASVSLVRKNLHSLFIVGLPLIVIASVLNADGLHAGPDTVQRLTFIAATFVLSIFLARVLSPRHGIFRVHLLQNAHGWASRLQGIWYWSAVLTPSLIGLFALLGYVYTASQLAWRLHVTIVLLVVLVMVTAFFTRMLLVQRRRINIEAAKMRRAATLEHGETAVEDSEIPTADELRSQIVQSRSLLRTLMVGVALLGIWMTWVDVLPALGLLEQRPLWRSIRTVAEMKTDDLGNVSYVSRDVLDNVTISDAVFSLLLVVGISIAARNVPGLLEISILQRLPIDASIRYAIKTVVSYAIIVLGMIVACSSIGIHWNQIQWMAAALTFGLAFGLQEMFANFIAGLIILIERPVRVGDIVTIDDVTGKVSRVRIRATTITSWDRKDYLVPNKDFITGRVLNWTLSSRFNRIVIPVGVAYGSDKDEVVRQLLRVAIEHPQVVSDPAPSATFEEFANSSLNYVLRCYIAMDDISSRLQIVHELHTGIDDAFRKAGIEIPFPQQDLHLRSVDPEVKLG